MVTALWTVTVVLAIVAIADSVGLIALTRQVGLLHLRLGSGGQLLPPGGPAPGRRLRLDPGQDSAAGPVAEAELVILGFVRPGCSACAAMLPAFSSLGAELAAAEQVLLVSDAGDTATQGYLAAAGVSLPLVTGPHLISANGIPAVPYAVVTDGAGIVLEAQPATSAADLSAMVSRARSGRVTARPVTPETRHARVDPLPGDPPKEERYVV